MKVEYPRALGRPRHGDKEKKPGGENFNMGRQAWLPASKQEELCIVETGLSRKLPVLDAS